MPGRKISDRSRSERGYGVIDIDAPWNYKPWIRSRDVCQGNGQRYVIPDLKYPNRQVHLMSNLELKAYYLLRKNEQVKEVFEQYPLVLRRTILISERMDITHPRDPQSGKKIVMTTDFLAAVREEEKIKFRAYAIKHSEDLKKQRVLEKLKIEKEYWKELGVPWCIITENELK